MIQQDRAILRDLAKRQRELAHSPHNLAIVADWRRHAARIPGRPMVHIEIDNFQEEVIEPRLRCSGVPARRIEHRLYHAFANQELFGDDKPIPPFFAVELQTFFWHDGAGGLSAAHNRV